MPKNRRRRNGSTAGFAGQADRPDRAQGPALYQPRAAETDPLRDALFASYIEPIIVVSARTGIVRDANNQAGVWLSIPAEDLPGRSIFDFLPDLSTDDFRGCLDRDARRTLAAPGQLLVSDVSLGGKTIEVLCAPIDYASERLVSLILRLPTEALRREAAFRDPLTGLPNRHWFDRRLHRSYRRAMRSSRVANTEQDITASNSPMKKNGFAVLYVDLDRFKSINDEHGHGVGDDLLRAVAQRLLRCIRPQDMVSRRGGDEFTILLDSIPGEGTARRVAERILRSFEPPFSIGEHNFNLAVSVGICVLAPHHSHPSQLLDDADVSLYRVKDAGGEGYALGFSGADRRRPR